MSLDLDADVVTPSGTDAGPAVPGAVARRVRDAVTTWTPAHLMALTLVLGAAVSRLGPPGDPDVWWHLRTGTWILDHHRLPTVDHWSTGAAGHAWMAHEWLAQVVITLFYRAFGYHGISAYRAIGVLVLLALLAVQAFRRTTPYRALLVTALAVFATQGGWGERPQLISFILLVPTAELLRRASRSGRVPWGLIPLTWLWANIHGLWFLAIGLVGVTFVGHLLDRRADGVQFASRLVLLGAGMAAAAALTPNGPGLLLEPLHVQAYARYVSEWDPTNVRDILGLPLFLLLALCLLGWARSRERRTWTEILMVAFAAFLGLSYIRTIAPGAVLLVPYAAEALQSLPARRRRDTAPWQLKAGIAGAIAGLAVAGALVTISVTPTLPPGAPVAATRAINDLPQPQRVLDDYGIGGWLLWFAPTAHPAIDGRTEIYTTHYLNDYFAMIKMSGDWKRTVQKIHPTSTLLPVGTPVINGLRDELHWHTLYQDENWVVLVPPSSGSTSAGR